MQLLY